MTEFIYDYMIIHTIMSSVLIATIFFYAWYNKLSWKGEIRIITVIFTVAIFVPFLPVVCGYIRFQKDIIKAYKNIK